MTRTLSKQEASLVLELEWRGQRIVSRAEVIQAMNGDAGAADGLIRSLRRKNWLERIGAGTYMLIPAERGPEGVPDMNMLVLGSLVTSPYYYSFATATAFHNLSVQMRNEVYVACRQRLRPRIVRGFRFRFVYLKQEKFFGYAETNALGAEVLIADPEKAIVDSVDKPGYAGGIGEVAAAIARGSRVCDWNRLTAYALKMNSVALVQRLGYLMDFAGVHLSSSAREGLKGRIRKHSRSYLGSTRIWGQEGTFNSEWQLVVNVPREEMIADI